MQFTNNKDHDDDKDIFPINENEFDDGDFDEDDDESLEDSEDLDEVEEIEAKLEKGEDVAYSVIESIILPKSRLIYSCPRCRKIHLNNKWIKDNITDIFAVRTELAYCPKCLDKTYENFVGSVEIYDKKLNEIKDDIIEVAHRVERELEDAPQFENIINTVVKSEIMFIFTNTSRLALEIGRRIRQEFQGGIQYEWFERNQFLRIKWYSEVNNKDAFKERIRSLKERRFGMFSFEEE